MGEVEKMQLDAAIRGMIGPELRGNAVIVEGRRIPYLHCFEHADSIEFILDGRFGLVIPKALATNVAWFLANALAIGNGYPFLGSETKARPFAPRITCLGEIPPEEAV